MVNHSIYFLCKLADCTQYEYAGFRVDVSVKSCVLKCVSDGQLYRFMVNLHNSNIDFFIRALIKNQ